MIKIKIELDSNCLLNQKQAEYIFETLCIIIGVSWSFVRDKQADIYYGKKSNQDALLNINARCKKTEKEQIFKYNDLYFLGENIEPYQKTNEKCQFGNDIIFNCFYFLTGTDELNIERNKWDQHNIKQSILYKNDLLHEPIVNGYANFIKHLFQGRFEFIPMWPGNKKAALALSHDVDYPEMIKPIELLRYLMTYKFKASFKTFWQIIIGKETFWQFENYMNLEKKYNVRSSFYFCSYQGNLPRFFLKAPDPFYNIKKSKYLKVVEQLRSEGFEVGLHSSFLAFSSKNRFEKEVNKLKGIFKLSNFGHRHHYWHTNPEDPSETCLIHQELGLAYDSSLSFEQHSGFRYSICTPFHIWNRKNGKALEILQLPPTLMDDHLFGYKHLSNFSSYKENIDNAIAAILKSNGVFVVDFHARVLNKTFFPKWGESYEYLLQQIEKSNNFFIDTPMNINKHWRDREAKIRSKSV